MSIESVRRSLEIGLSNITPPIDTAWEGVRYAPRTSVAYQEVRFQPAPPENPTIGSYFHREVGFFDVRLFYPGYKGSNAAFARAEAIRAVFTRGKTFRHNMVDTIIQRTPDISPGRIENGRYVIDVSIRYFANIYAARRVTETVPSDVLATTDTALSTLIGSDGLGVPKFIDVVFGGDPLQVIAVNPESLAASDTALSTLIGSDGLGVPKFIDVVFGGDPLQVIAVNPESLAASDTALSTLIGSDGLGVPKFSDVVFGGDALLVSQVSLDSTKAQDVLYSNLHGGSLLASVIFGGSIIGT